MLYLIFFIAFSNVEVRGRVRVLPYQSNNRVEYAPGYVCNFELRYFNDAFLLYTCVPTSKCKEPNRATKAKRQPYQIHDNCPQSFKEGTRYVCCHPSDDEQTPQSTPNVTHPPYNINFMPGFRSIFKCNDYKTLLCFNKDFCPQSRRRVLVKGGTETRIGKYPHIAVIGRFDSNTDQEWYCLGSIISDRYVLSAASCRSDSKGQSTHVRVGENRICNINGDESECDSLKEAQLLRIELHILHPGAQEDWYYHDIMLVRVRRKIKFNDRVRPACLFTEMTAYQSNGMFAMYEEERARDKVIRSLHEMEISVDTAEDCSQFYANDEKLSEGRPDLEIMFCAGLPVHGKVPCQGDYGGPLQIQEENPYCMWKIYGVVAKTEGVTCGGHKSALFTRLPYYIGWIEDQVWPVWEFDLLREYSKSTEICSRTIAPKTPVQDIEEGRCEPNA